MGPVTMSSYLIIWTSTGLDIEDWVLPSTPRGRNNIVQTWTKSPIFSVQIQSHFFIFLWNHFKSNCLYWKSPMSLFWGLTLSANYSRTPRDYLIQRESSPLPAPGGENCPVPQHSYCQSLPHGVAVERESGRVQGRLFTATYFFLAGSLI